MSKRDPRGEWPNEWLAFELLRRRVEYRAAWDDYRARRDTPGGADPHGWGAIIAAVAGPRPAAAPPETRQGEQGGPDLLSQHWAIPFGLQYMLDPDRDAEAHGHIPWRPAQGPVPVGFVRGPESSVFDPAASPRLGRGFRRFVALRFDLGRPIEPQLAEAKALLEAAQGPGVAPSRGRSAANVVAALEVLDLKAAGATNAEVARRVSPKCRGPANFGTKMVKRARKLQAEYRTVATGTAVEGDK